MIAPWKPGPAELPRRVHDTVVNLTPLVGSGDRTHVLDGSCWCKPKILRRWWNGQDVAVHRPARIDGSSDV